MSGVLSALQAAGRMFGGFYKLTLGPVTFDSLELPANMPIGGRHALVVHELPGGARVIDAMGPQEGVISWSGILYQQAQSTRARLLDRLRQSGSPVKLAWGDYSYQVIVSEFHCDTRIVGPMPYRITCLVVQNNTIPKGTSLLAMAEQVTSDLASGNVLGAVSSVSQGVISGPITAATTAAGLAGATTVGSSLYNAAVSAVNGAAAAITTARQAADSVISGIAAPVENALGVSASSVSVTSLLGGIQQAVVATGDAANLEAGRGFIARAARNLLNASA